MHTGFSLATRIKTEDKTEITFDNNDTVPDYNYFFDFSANQIWKV